MSSLRLSIAAMAAALVAPAAAQPPEGAAVNGMGGFFFRAEDPKALADWYFENLGINKTPSSYEDEPWHQEYGPTVFAPFSKDNEYFSTEKTYMLNMRTSNLDALVEHLRENGNEVKVDPDTYPNGRFARVHDPEGNPIQLWEPKNPN